MPRLPHSLLSYLRVVAGAWRDDPREDAELLACFADSGDEAAFKALVCRHGPLVWRSCTRVLGDGPDAEDAFQTAFLALAHKAGRLRREPLAGWLHQVARQAALKVDIEATRRRNLEHRLRALTVSEAADIDRTELYAALDEELARLPQQLRLPLLLHYLEGKSQDEVAHLLGSSRGIVRRRLTRGEAMLRERLERRGLTVGIGLVAVLVGDSIAAPGIPTRLIGSTARAAVAFRSGTLTGGAAEAARAVLGAFPASLDASLLRKSLWVVLACCLGLGSATLATYRSLSAQPDERGEAGPAAAQAPGLPRVDGRAAARVDCYGDPLPAGALARMGTVRQWYGRIDGFGECIALNILTFSPDGKMLISQKDGGSFGSAGNSEYVCLWDAATGREIRRITTDTSPRVPTLLALSPDGRMLITGKEDTVSLWEMATGKLLHKLAYQGPKREAYFKGITCLPNGKILTLDRDKAGGGSDNRIYLWDVARGGREISRLKDRRENLDINSRTLTFSRDGKMVAATEGFSSRIVQLWEVATGKKIHQLQPTREEGEENARNISVCSVTFSPDGKKLAGGRDTFGVIYEWDVATGKLTRRFKASGVGPASPLTYSPDGKTLLGEWGGHLWDVDTGKEIRSFGWKHGKAKVAVFSPNGKIVAMADEAGVIRLWEVATGKEILPHKGHHDRVTSLAYSPDGKTLASTSYDQTVRLWEAATGKEIRKLPKHMSGTWGSRSLAYSPDGTILASMDIRAVYLWDAVTGKEIRQFREEESPRSVTFSSDGKLLATTVGGGTVCLWQVTTGRQIYQQRSTDYPGSSDNPLSVVFSPDGRMLAVPGKDGTVDLWETATGKSTGLTIGQLQQSGLRQRVQFLAFSPDGRILATSSPRHTADSETHLWEVATGKEICPRNRLGPKNDWRGAGLLTFSPDSRILAAVERANWCDDSKKIHLWEVATGKQIGQLSGHRSAIRSIAFSSDGKTLASCSDDLTCLVWDLIPFACPLKPVQASSLASQVLSKEKLEAAWADLAQEPAKAYAAIRDLQVTPTQAIALLRERVRPVAPLADPQQLQRWIADLNDNNFMVRVKAQREIEKLGEVAIPALRQALQGQPVLEVKRRLQDLLADLEPKVVIISPRHLREFRAVQVLESIGTREAQQVLQAWAKGLPGARLTVEAEAALGRLAKRPAAGL